MLACTCCQRDRALDTDTDTEGWEGGVGVRAIPLESIHRIRVSPDTPLIKTPGLGKSTSGVALNTRADPASAIRSCSVWNCAASPPSFSRIVSRMRSPLSPVAASATRRAGEFKQSVILICAETASSAHLRSSGKVSKKSMPRSSPCLVTLSRSKNSWCDHPFP